MNKGTRNNFHPHPEKRKTAVKKRPRRNSKTKNELSVSKTIVLCVLIVAACFLLLFINTEHGENKESVPVPAISEGTIPVSPEVPLRDSDAGKDQTENSVVQQQEESSGYQKPEKNAVPQKNEKQEAPAVIQKEKPSAVQKLPVIPVKPEKKPETSARELPSIPPAVNHARLVFVFDDAGQNTSQLEKYVTLPFPVTIAVLPGLKYSKACADRVRASADEVMLHQPMQAVDLKINPGPGAVTPEMQASRITALVKKNIEEIGPVAGINNHEGSLISEDEIKIGAVMQAAKESGAFFLDSRTTNQTRVPQASMELGIPYYERNVFLDNSRNRTEIIKEIMRGLDIANTKGAVIMIGHVWSADILPGILIEMYPPLRNKGYVFTTVSKSGAIIQP
jgi:uncharacterized protein